MKYIKLFQTIADKQAATLDYPNTNYVVENSKASIEKEEPVDQEYVVAKYNITDTSNPTKIMGLANDITAMIVDGVQQQSVTTGYTFSTTGTHTVKYKVRSNWEPSFGSCATLTSITMPDSVSGIRNYAFSKCSGLTKIHLSSGATYIGEYAFQDCRSLPSITIPDNATKIGYAAFNNCTGLTSIEIPSGVTYIGNYTFNDCSSLTSITVAATTPPSMTEFMALNNTNNCPIYVPADSVNTYKTTYAWSTYASRIQPIQ